MLVLIQAFFLALLTAPALWAQEKVIVSYDGNSGFQAAIWTAKDTGRIF